MQKSEFLFAYYSPDKRVLTQILYKMFARFGRKFELGFSQREKELRKMIPERMRKVTETNPSKVNCCNRCVVSVVADNRWPTGRSIITTLPRVYGVSELLLWHNRIIAAA